MESTFVSSELVAQLDFMLSNEDLEGIKNLLQTLNSEEKAIFANYCQSNDLQYCNYWQAIELISNQSYEGLVDSIYHFRNYNPYSIRVVEARLDILNQMLFQRHIKDDKSEMEALNLVDIQELRMRLDLMSKKSSWRSSENISRCWDITESLDSFGQILPEEAMIDSLVKITIDFVAKDKKNRMRRLKPSPILIRYIRKRDCFRLFRSKEEKLIKKWQKVYNSAKQK